MKFNKKPDNGTTFHAQRLKNSYAIKSNLEIQLQSPMEIPMSFFIYIERASLSFI